MTVLADGLFSCTQASAALIPSQLHYLQVAPYLAGLISFLKKIHFNAFLYRHYNVSSFLWRIKAPRMEQVLCGQGEDTLFSESNAHVAACNDRAPLY